MQPNIINPWNSMVSRPCATLAAFQKMIYWRNPVLHARCNPCTRWSDTQGITCGSKYELEITWPYNCLHWHSILELTGAKGWNYYPYHSSRKEGITCYWLKSIQLWLIYFNCKLHILTFMKLPLWICKFEVKLELISWI